MVTISDLQHLIDEWTERMGKPSHTSSYKDAMMDCIYDLNKVILHSINEELAYNEAFMKDLIEEYQLNAFPDEHAA